MYLVNEVCSLGNLCHSAYLLKNNKLKKCSYPFDWIFSNVDIIIDCLNNNFNFFLKKEYLIDHSNFPNDKNKCGHKLYHKNMFYHHNPRLDENYKYYKRCINRFNNLLKNDNNKLFLIINVNNKNKLNLNIKEKLKKLNNTLSKYTKNYRILYIHHIISNNLDHDFYIEDNIDYIQLYTNNKSNGTKFIDENANTYLKDILFKHYKFY